MLNEFLNSRKIKWHKNSVLPAFGEDIRKFKESNFTFFSCCPSVLDKVYPRQLREVAT